eukprot:TRINITY_DN48553_c0_g1_i1.p2 TRINITY_DN48553_c0_g1~~TRINITY_DN48553_c0_g1_i1.p2  ORF type:complete len:121 (-),score=25.64 TRINITY_DN48553_c0_g1_i1:45-407(-)
MCIFCMYMICGYQFYEKVITFCYMSFFFFFQAEDGIRDVERSRGLGDVYKRQILVFERGIRLDEKRGKQNSKENDRTLQERKEKVLDQKNQRSKKKLQNKMKNKLRKIEQEGKELTLIHI